MARADRVLVISRPLETVFEYLADPRSLAEWDPYTQSMDRISGDGEAGSRYANVSRYRSVHMAMTYETVVLIPGQRIRCEGDNRFVHTIDEFRLQLVPSGIRVDYHAEFRVKAFTKVTDLALRRAVSAATDNISRSLAARLEQLPDI